VSVSKHLAFSAHVDVKSTSRVAAGAAPGLQECTNLLADSAVYYLDLDVADQRAALIDFYDSPQTILNTSYFLRLWRA